MDEYLPRNLFMAHTAKLNPKTNAVVATFAKRLRAAHIPYEELIVFGSYAKGTAKPWSDIDLCIVSRAFGKDRHKERVKLMHIRNDDTIDIEPHPFHPKELADTYDSLAHEIRTYGISVIPS